MDNRGIACVLVATMFAGGCVTKSSHEVIVSQLEECRQDKSAAQDAAQACERRFAREVERFEAMDATLEDVLPATMQEFEQQRDRILELVPVQVQEEVGAYMEDFSNAVSKGLSVLKDDNETLKQDNRLMIAELKVAQSELRRLGVSTDSIGSQVDAIRSSLEQQEAMRHEAADIAETIRQFDNSMVVCRDCDDRLRLNRRERETISRFHAEVIAMLAELERSGDEGEADVDEVADERVGP